MTANMPSGCIHFHGVGSPLTLLPSTPVAVSRADTNTAVFYNDGNGCLAGWSWNANYRPPESPKANHLAKDGAVCLVGVIGSAKDGASPGLTFLSPVIS